MPSTMDADQVRVRHMFDAANEAISFVRKKMRSDLDTDRQLVLSLIKEIEIIGEAASRVSKFFREQYSDIPWDIIIATRHRLIHGYFEVNPNLVWQTVTTDLPTLAGQLRKIL